MKTLQELLDLRFGDIGAVPKTLACPSKSDLQQRDILIVEDAAIRARINALLKDQDWIPGCPPI